MIPVLWLLACGAEPDAPDPALPGATVSADGPSPLRRLTADQYANTLADLFPGVALPDPGVLEDGEVHGFHNNAQAQTPSALLIEQYQRAAVAATAAAWEQPGEWLSCPLSGGPDPLTCGEDFLTDFGARAFRRPLTPEEEALYLGFYAEILDEEEFAVALQVALQAFLNAPEFLYFPEFGADGVGGPRVPLTGYELASRLSYFLWDSPPDAALIDAAASGRLDEASGVEEQAWRMIEDPRAALALASFHRQWLELDEIALVAPDPEAFPDWRPEVAEAMRAELDTWILQVMRSDAPTVSSLLLDPSTVYDPLLAPIYGVPDGAVLLPTDERAGLLTRAGWLAATSHAVHPSPVLRGVFVLDHLMCVPPAPPPADVNTDVEAVEAASTATNRERYAVHATEPRCAGCHANIDPIGFGFEGYDAIGRFRTHDGEVPVDATGTFTLGDLSGAGFDGGVEVSALLAGSRTVHDCVALQWFRVAHGRSEGVGDEPELETIREAFSATGGDVRQLLVEIVLGDLFRTRRAP